MKRIRRRASRAVRATTQYLAESLECRILLDAGPTELVPAPEGEDTVMSFRVDNDGEAYPTYECTVDWGDGTGAGGVDLEQQVDPRWGMTYLAGSAAHAYADSGEYDISWEIRAIWAPGIWDPTGSGTEHVTITNTAPYADISSTFDEASDSLNLALVNPADPSYVDANAGLHYSAALDFNSLAQTYEDASDTPQTLQLDSQQVIEHDGWLRIFDKDGGYRDYNPGFVVPDLAVAATSCTTASLTWQDILPTAPAYRISRSTDGVNWSIYKDIDRADLTFSDDLITYNDTGLEDGSSYSYRVRALDTSGGGNETVYAPVKSTITPLFPPTDVMATNVNNATNDIEVSWDPGATYDQVIIRKYEEDNGVFDTTPIDEVTIDGSESSFTFTNNEAEAAYGFTVQGITGNGGSQSQMSSYSSSESSNSGSSGGGASSDETSPVENFDEPTRDWTNVVWDNEKGQQAPNAAVNWDPMNSYTDDGETVDYVGDYENDQTVTLTVSNLPRHTWAKVGGWIEATGLANDDLSPNFIVTVSGGGVQVNSHPTWTGGPDWISGIWGFSPGENTHGNPDAFKHDAKNLTITITAHGLNDEEYNSWRWTPHVYADTFLPIVSLSGSGTVIEDGTGSATFTAHRAGSGTVISEPLVVKLKDAGAGLADAASEGTDYQPINEIVIPAGQNDGSVDVQAIDDPDAEGLESIFKSIAKKPIYALAAPPATAPATNPATQKANIDDDAVIRSVAIHAMNDADHEFKNDAFRFDFVAKFEVHGEHLDQFRGSQTIHATTTLWDWDGTELDGDAVLQQYGNVDHPEWIVSSGWPQDWEGSFLTIKDGSHNGVGFLEDNQAESTITKTVPRGFGSVKIGMEMLVDRQMELTFAVPGHPQTGYVVPWGFDWDNFSARWTADANPPEPVCVSPNYGTGKFSNADLIDGLPE